MNDEKKIWLVSTDHLEDGLWFREEEDFKYGMNFIAAQAVFSAVTILAFILMSNHVHFILYGTREEVLAFINGFKTRHARYLQHKYGVREALRRNGVDIREIQEDDEALERAIAYVQMNCVAANICSHPVQYPWGTGDTFFNAAGGDPLRPSEKKDAAQQGGVPGQLAARRRRLHSPFLLFECTLRGVPVPDTPADGLLPEDFLQGQEAD